jgi:hypothetical protein
MEHEGLDGIVFEELDKTPSEKHKQAGDVLAKAMLEYSGRKLRVSDEGDVLLEMEDGTEKVVYLDAQKNLKTR